MKNGPDNGCFEYSQWLRAQGSRLKTQGIRTKPDLLLEALILALLIEIKV